MKALIFVFAFFITSNLIAQDRAIEITNIKSGKIKLFEQNQRVKLRTVDGKKHVGNLQFSDDNTIVIGNSSFPADSIQSIKSQPKVLATIKTVVLITGLVVVGSSVVVAATGSNAAFLLFAAGSGMAIGAGVLESLNTNHSTRKWTYKIITR